MNLKIGELATRAACQVGAIRYYEKQGLLRHPARSEGNFRLYDERHMQRLLFIRKCRALDMTLTEIRMLLATRETPSPDCSSVDLLLDKQISRVAARVAELEDLKAQLTSLRKDAEQPAR